MKRTLITLLTLAVAAGLWAAGGIDLAPAKVLPGNQVVLTVRMAFPEAPTAAEFQVKFDPRALEFVRLEKGPLTVDAMHAVHEVRGTLRGAFASAEPFPASEGVLCTLIFKVKDGSLKSTNFNLDRVLINDRPQESRTMELDLQPPLQHTSGGNL